ncbi:low molecular weight protein arginine phosphatase [Caldalkalibacillus salinus]|uniref:arsenate reductase/protein-tyrosine-phosphatase family protein n=1 Tax=Caldalkalibacillus salinus TaxID=2803787 RepID=UPI0019243300|nr:low molecular weight protein arginine phosphatase [Caldalkalibacillus salinus]
MKHILFVCTGNTCRSPLAESLLRHKAPELFHVQSAGIAAVEGGAAAEHVQRLLAEQGVQLDHQSQNVSPELMEWADLILTMTAAHQAILQDMYPEKKDTIYPLKKYVDPNCEQVNIMDPFGGDYHIYKFTMEEIDALLEQLKAKHMDE